MTSTSKSYLFYKVEYTLEVFEQDWYVSDWYLYNMDNFRPVHTEGFITPLWKYLFIMYM